MFFQPQKWSVEPALRTFKSTSSWSTTFACWNRKAKVSCASARVMLATCRIEFNFLCISSTVPFYSSVYLHHSNPRFSFQKLKNNIFVYCCKEKYIMKVSTVTEKLLYFYRKLLTEKIMCFLFSRTLKKDDFINFLDLDMIVERKLLEYI